MSLLMLVAQTVSVVFAMRLSRTLAVEGPGDLSCWEATHVGKVYESYLQSIHKDLFCMGNIIFSGHTGHTVYHVWITHILSDDTQKKSWEDQS